MELVTPAGVAEERRKVGHPLVALLNVWAKVAQGDAGEWIHYGATTADIYDTVQLQQARRAAQMLIVDLQRAEDAMLKLAEAHRATPMIGRTNGLIMAEHAMFILGQKIGKHTAHEEVGAAAKAAWTKGTTLEAELAARPSVGKYVKELDLGKQLDPSTYIGLAPQSVDRTVAAIRKARAGD